MESVFLPTLHSFRMGNVFTGSSGNLRFRAAPVSSELLPADPDSKVNAIHAEYWHGLFCYEKSQIEESADFPLTVEGLEQMRQWLTDNR